MKKMTMEEFDEWAGITKMGCTASEVNIYYGYYVIGRQSVRW